MGRKIPVGENPSIHPILSLSLLVACIAATIAIVSSLCSALSRRKSSAAEQQALENSHIVNPQPDEGGAAAAASPATTGATESDDESQLPLPAPPGMAHSRAASYSFRSNSIAPRGRLSSSMSMRVPGGALGSMRLPSKRWDVDNTDNKKKEKKTLKHEDSIWKKTIILGEKCRVPDEEDDTILYDEKGNRISTYHNRKTPTSVSRQASGINVDAIPS